MRAAGVAVAAVAAVAAAFPSQTLRLPGFQVVAGLAEIFRWQSRRSDDVPSTFALVP
jgi:hypothetical protein